MQLNASQMKILSVGVIVACLMILFPPWTQGARGVYTSAGYGFLFYSPEPSFGGIYIDVRRLLVQLGLVALVTGWSVFLMGKGRKGA